MTSKIAFYDRLRSHFCKQKCENWDKFASSIIGTFDKDQTLRVSVISAL